MAQVSDLQQQLTDEHAQLCSTRTASAAAEAAMAASIASLEEKVCACSSVTEQSVLPYNMIVRASRSR